MVKDNVNNFFGHPLILQGNGSPVVYTRARFPLKILSYPQTHTTIAIWLMDTKEV